MTKTLVAMPIAKRKAFSYGDAARTAWLCLERVFSQGEMPKAIASRAS
ncbi:hypothetical protein [Nostoc sp.]